MVPASGSVGTAQFLAQQALVHDLNERHAGSTAADLVRIVCGTLFRDRVAAVSSFGAEAAVLLHMVADVLPATPVIFLDTGKHFSETRAYMAELVDRLGLNVVVTAFPSRPQIAAEDPDGDLSGRNPDLCCHVRKTLPMFRALRPYAAFMTGRKRFQTETRQAMMPFEAFERWIRINPLWNWSSDDVRNYFARHGLPQHPLVARGYTSIGCEPCTRAIGSDEDPRAGRWAGQDKTECGIHLTPDGRIVPAR